jgi:quercetin dioxygenase-like cupin family protein
MMAALYDYEPNLQMERLHYHVMRESAYIVSGRRGEDPLERKNHVLIPESIVYISPGDVHGVIGTGPKGLRLLEIWSPLRRI